MSARIGRRALLRGDFRRVRTPPPVHPPGALDAARFDALCDGCGHCAQVCPADAIVIDGPATDLSDHSPRINVADAPCVMCDGLMCSTVCPTGALAPVTPETMRIAVVTYDSDACWAAAGIDPGCDYCYDRCPRKGLAVTLRRGVGPVFDAAHCTGCGVCVHFCPSAPKALTLTADEDRC